jgi:uncharacterized membrane protein YqaE (UPF0057 family)
MSSSLNGPNKSNTINARDWTLFDKFMYGGLGYGSFCLPSDFFKVIITILFPPMGEICNIVEDTINLSFPYINLKTLKNLILYDNLKRIIYSFVLTTLFYIPGLIYTLTGIVNKQRKVSYDAKPLYWNTNNWAQNTIDDLETGTNKISSGGNLIGNELSTGYQETETVLSDIGQIGILF